MKYNEIMDENYQEEEEENGSSIFLGGWSNLFTLLES